MQPTWAVIVSRLRGILEGCSGRIVLHPHHPHPFDKITNIPTLYPTSSCVADIFVMEISFDPIGPTL